MKNFLLKAFTGKWLSKRKKPIINFLRLLSVCNAEANYVNKNKYFNASLEEVLRSYYEASAGSKSARIFPV